MGLIKTVLTNHAYSIAILLCTIISGGAVIEYKVEQLEFVTAKQIERLEEVGNTVHDMQIELSVIRTNQENYIKWRDRDNIAAAVSRENIIAKIN